MINKIAIITSGGDSPGMNACIRAIVLTAEEKKIEVIGFLRGYDGIIDNMFVKLRTENVADIIHTGGTILKSARSSRFMKTEFIKLAAQNLMLQNVNALIVIGGDGTFKGALALAKHTSIPILGCAGTIDNDLVGTDFTIGYDTAINTVVEAVDKLRDTARSHDRVFVVEVMGKDAGLIALRSAIASGADAVLVPELKRDQTNLLAKLTLWRTETKSRIVIVAEGDESGGGIEVVKFIKSHLPEADVKLSVLGHIQRGGNPSCMERVNASTVGYHAVNALLNKHSGEMVGIVNKSVVYTPFEKAVKHHQTLKPELETLITVLSGR